MSLPVLKFEPWSSSVPDGQGVCKLESPGTGRALLVPRRVRRELQLVPSAGLARRPRLARHRVRAGLEALDDPARPLRAGGGVVLPQPEQLADVWRLHECLDLRVR